MDWSTFLSGSAVGFVAALLLVLGLGIFGEKTIPSADQPAFLHEHGDGE